MALTVQDWLAENAATYTDREELIAACRAATGCGRDQVVRKLRTVSVSSTAHPVSGATGGFPLRGKDVLATKPTSVWPARFAALQPGMGYRLETLAEQWHASVNTVKDRARQCKCIRWVGDDAGEYVECVVHPQTEGGK